MATSPGRARADESPYCDKIAARAQSDAAQLMWPHLFVQAIRFPRSAQIDVGPVAGNGYQARVGIAYALLDIFKGAHVLRVGDADCKQHEASADLEDILAHGLDGARLSALVEQARFLDAHRDEWRTLVDTADQRLAGHIITLVELDELRRLAEELDRKLTQVHGEIETLAAQAVPLASGSLARLTERYLERARRTEREIARVRKLDPWQIQISVGVIPQAPVDWYGVAELNLNLGGFLRAHEENRYLAARDRELKQARYELPLRLDQYRKQVRASAHATRRELETVERALTSLDTSQRALAQSDAPNIAHARDTLAIERLSLDSDRAFLRAFMTSLSALSEDDHAVE